MIKSIILNNIENFIEQWNTIQENEGVIILDNNTEILDAEKIVRNVLPIFNDEKIGFVYSDVLIRQKDFEYQHYFDGINIHDTSFLLKKIKNLQVPNNILDIKLNLMQQTLQKQYYFEHIAEPLFVKSV